MLDYSCSGQGHVSGTVDSGWGVATQVFDGWLDLMRLLEDLGLQALDVSAGDPDALSANTPAGEGRHDVAADTRGA